MISVSVERARKAHKARMNQRNHLPEDVRELLRVIDECTGPGGEIYGHRDGDSGSVSV